MIFTQVANKFTRGGAYKPECRWYSTVNDGLIVDALPMPNGKIVRRIEPPTRETVITGLTPFHSGFYERRK